VLLTRKNVAIHWGVREAQAFEDLKRAVKCSPVLLPACEDAPYFIVTDASDFAVGASLEQTINRQGSAGQLRTSATCRIQRNKTIPHMKGNF
jgi:hypothetical protein